MTSLIGPVLMLFAGSVTAAPDAGPWVEPVLFLCTTYQRHEFDPTSDGRLVAEYEFEPENFAVLFQGNSSGSDASFKVSADPSIFDGSNSAMLFQTFQNGSLRLGVASVSRHLKNANHQDAILIYERDDKRSFALATVTQSEWLHGDKGYLLERTYMATCTNSKASDIRSKFDEFSK